MSSPSVPKEHQWVFINWIRSNCIDSLCAPLVFATIKQINNGTDNRLLDSIVQFVTSPPFNHFCDHLGSISSEKYPWDKWLLSRLNSGPSYRWGGGTQIGVSHNDDSICPNVFTKGEKSHAEQQSVLSCVEAIVACPSLRICVNALVNVLSFLSLSVLPLFGQTAITFHLSL